MKRLFFWQKEKVQLLGDDVKSGRIDALADEMLAKLEKDVCLDIGTGRDEAGKFTTVDIDTDVGADIVGDVRCLFAASDYYRSKRELSPDLSRITDSHYMFVRMKHIVEHVEWIYHPTLFQWLFQIVAPGGAVDIHTPNLDYIARLYVKNLDLYSSQRRMKFPAHEYEGMSPDKPEDLAKWTNFKLFSGCSPGDYHHACLSRMLLLIYLSQAGFDRMLVFDGSTLRVLAYKGSQAESDLVSAISDYLKE